MLYLMTGVKIGFLQKCYTQHMNIRCYYSELNLNMDMLADGSAYQKCVCSLSVMTNHAPDKALHALKSEDIYLSESIVLGAYIVSSLQ